MRRPELSRIKSLVCAHKKQSYQHPPFERARSRRRATLAAEVLAAAGSQVARVRRVGVAADSKMRGGSVLNANQAHAHERVT